MRVNTNLSKRQKEVSQLKNRGYSLSEIAIKLNIKRTTVQTHLRRAENKKVYDSNVKKS